MQFEVYKESPEHRLSLLLKLQYESQGGRPPAEIQWWDGEGRRIVSDVTEHVKRMEDTKMFKTVSTLRFTPSTGQLSSYQFKGFDNQK